MLTALRIATLSTAFRRKKHYSQRYELSWRRYHANFAVAAQQGDAAEDGDYFDADADYEKQAEVRFAGLPPEISEAEQYVEEGVAFTVHVSAGELNANRTRTLMGHLNYESLAVLLQNVPLP